VKLGVIMMMMLTVKTMMTMMVLVMMMTMMVLVMSEEDEDDVWTGATDDDVCNKNKTLFKHGKFIRNLTYNNTNKTNYNTFESVMMTMMFVLKIIIIIIMIMITKFVILFSWLSTSVTVASTLPFEVFNHPFSRHIYPWLQCTIFL